MLTISSLPEKKTKSNNLGPVAKMLLTGPTYSVPRVKYRGQVQSNVKPDQDMITRQAALWKESRPPLQTLGWAQGAPLAASLCCDVMLRLLRQQAWKASMEAELRLHLAKT